MTTLLFDGRAAGPLTRAPPQPPKPAPARDYISFSAIRTYQQCPLRYFFRYIAGMPDETISASLVFGSAIHRAVEHHFRRQLETNSPATQEELLGEYRSEWQNQTRPVRFSRDEHADSFDELANRKIEAFSQSSLAKAEGRILGIEESLRGAVIPGLPDLLGKVDLIIETPSELVITDWKTSRSKYTPDQVDESAAQLLLYGELAKDFAPSKQLRLQFGVLTKTKEVNVDVHRVAAEQTQLDRTKRVVERVWHAVQAEHFFPAPSQMNCPGCPYREPCRKWPG